MIKATLPLEFASNYAVKPNPIVCLLVEDITPKEQWNAAIFSTAILLGTNIPWVSREKNPLGDTLYLCK